MADTDALKPIAINLVWLHSACNLQVRVGTKQAYDLAYKEDKPNTFYCPHCGKDCPVTEFTHE